MVEVGYESKQMSVQHFKFVQGVSHYEMQYVADPSSATPCVVSQSPAFAPISLDPLQQLTSHAHAVSPSLDGAIALAVETPLVERLSFDRLQLSALVYAVLLFRPVKL